MTLEHIGSFGDKGSPAWKNVYLRSEIYTLAKALNDQTEPAIETPSHRAGIPIVPAIPEGRLFITETGFRTSFDTSALPISQLKNITPPSYRLAIYALLSLLAEPSRSARNQSGIKTEILERFPGVRGLSKRNLDEIFAAANKAMSDAE